MKNRPNVLQCSVLDSNVVCVTGQCRRLKPRLDNCIYGRKRTKAEGTTRKFRDRVSLLLHKSSGSLGRCLRCTEQDPGGNQTTMGFKNKNKKGKTVHS